MSLQPDSVALVGVNKENREYLCRVPGDLGSLFFATVFGVGLALILFSPDLARVKPPELSGIYGVQIEKWGHCDNVEESLFK